MKTIKTATCVRLIVGLLPEQKTVFVPERANLSPQETQFIDVLFVKSRKIRGQVSTFNGIDHYLGR